MSWRKGAPAYHQGDFFVVSVQGGGGPPSIRSIDKWSDHLLQKVKKSRANPAAPGHMWLDLSCISDPIWRIVFLLNDNGSYRVD